MRIGEQGGFPPLRWIETLRIRTERLIDVIYTQTEVETHLLEPSLHAQLLKGILLGKRSDVPQKRWISSETVELSMCSPSPVCTSGLSRCSAISVSHSSGSHRRFFVS